MKIEIERCKCPSWNDMQTAFWAKRSVERDELKNLTFCTIFATYNRSEFKRRVLAMKKPAEVRVEAHFKNSVRRDPDNLYVKPILDGIVKAGLLPDDNGEFISAVTLCAKVKMPMDKIIISINEK